METNSMTSAEGGLDTVPTVRKLEMQDIRDALKLGWADFNAKPTHALMVALIYPVAALVMARLSLGADMAPVLFPLISGFALMGPVLAMGIYNISRQLEQGRSVAITQAMTERPGRRLGKIIKLGGVLMALFIAWLTSAVSIYYATLAPLMGDSGYTVSAFVTAVFTTAEGWLMIIFGHLFGLFYAAVVLSVAVISGPMILDRNVDVTTAVMTSLKVTVKSPLVVACWGLTIAVILMASTLPFFFALIASFPVLGHATWHIYRRAVA